MARLSGPLLDRMDIRIDVHTPTRADMAASGASDSATIRERVCAARERSRHRLAGTPWTCNAQLPGAWIRRHSGIDAELVASWTGSSTPVPRRCAGLTECCAWHGPWLIWMEHRHLLSTTSLQLSSCGMDTIMTTDESVWEGAWWSAVAEPADPAARVVRTVLGDRAGREWLQAPWSGVPAALGSSTTADWPKQ